MSCSSSTIGRLRRDGRDAMRLPADAVLIVIDVQEAIDDPRWGPRNNLEAEANIAALIAAWRAESLPLVHVRHDSVDPASPMRRMGRVIDSSAAPRRSTAKR